VRVVQSSLFLSRFQVGLHAFACGFPSHLESCAAAPGGSGGGVELVPVPVAAVGPYLSPALREGAMMTDVCERVLAAQAEFAPFPQVTTLVEFSGELNLRQWLFSLCPALVWKHAPL
jgi:hypothetical protein